VIADLFTVANVNLVMTTTPGELSRSACAPLSAAPRVLGHPTKRNDRRAMNAGAGGPMRARKPRQIHRAPLVLIENPCARLSGVRTGRRCYLCLAYLPLRLQDWATRVIARCRRDRAPQKPNGRRSKDGVAVHLHHVDVPGAHRHLTQSIRRIERRSLRSARVVSSPAVHQARHCKDPSAPVLI